MAMLLLELISLYHIGIASKEGAQLDDEALPERMNAEREKEAALHEVETKIANRLHFTPKQAIGKIE
jgi:hypothetical protein